MKKTVEIRNLVNNSVHQIFHVDFLSNDLELLTKFRVLFPKEEYKIIICSYYKE